MGGALDMAFRLPSGGEVRVVIDPPGSPVDDDRVDGVPTFAGRLLGALSAGHLRVLGASGEPIDVDALPLSDFHALRDLAERSGVVAVDPEVFEDYRCRNCDEPLPVSIEDAPLDVLPGWYGDEAPAPREHRVGDILMRPVTVGQARPLWRRLLGKGDTDLTPEEVRGLGIVAFAGADRPRAIARRLARASDEEWDRVEACFVYLNYPVRAFFPMVCEECGAVHEVPTPSVTEFPVDPDAERAILGYTDEDGRPPETFPDRDAFEDLVERIGGEVYGRRGVQNVALQVDFGVPPVDDAGEPLMGSYQPRYENELSGTTDVEFLISLYYVTFQRMWEQDGPYDVVAEIDETIDHEVEHHLYHLAGHDPMDDEERREARQDRMRTFGEERVRKAELAGTLGELLRIGRLLLVVALVLAVVVGVMYLLGRL